MFAMSVDQDGRDDTQADTQRHAETDTHSEKRGRGAGAWFRGIIVEQLNSVERGFCERLV